jgi:hypothetical protein
MKPATGVRTRDALGPTPSCIATVELPDDIAAQVDDWAARHQLTRAEAIRALVEIGLKAKK